MMDTTEDKMPRTAESRKTVGGELSLLNDKVLLAEKLIFGEGPTKAEDQSRPISSSLDGVICAINHLNKIMFRINKELELLK